MQLSGGEIKHSYQNDDKQKYNTSPQHNKYCFIHEPTKKRGASDHTPSKISTKIILTISVQGRCTDINTVFSYSADAGQTKKMYWSYEIK